MSQLSTSFRNAASFGQPNNNQVIVCMVFLSINIEGQGAFATLYILVQGEGVILTYWPSPYNHNARGFCMGVLLLPLLLLLLLHPPPLLILLPPLLLPLPLLLLPPPPLLLLLFSSSSSSSSSSFSSSSSSSYFSSSSSSSSSSPSSSSSSPSLLPPPLLLLLLLLLTLQPWVGLGLFNNSTPFLSILNLDPPTNNLHPL